MDQNTLDLLSKFVPGIIAIVSGVLTLITTHLLRNVGKIIVYVSSYSLEKYKRDGEGGESPENSLADAVSVQYRFELDFFNSSGIPKSLRAISIDLKPEKKNEIVSLKAYVQREQLTIINLPPKEIQHLYLSGSIKKEEIQLLQGKVDFFFKGMYPCGKTYRKKLITKEF